MGAIMDQDLDYEPNERQGGGYESEAGTQLVAASCVFCGKALRDPDSITAGCGPDCAEKYGVYKPAGPADPVAVERALKTAPEAMRDRVAPLVDDPADAMNKIIHIAGSHWERHTSNALHVLGSAIELSRALGYHTVADKIQRRYIEGADQGGNKGLVVKSEPEGWRLELPYQSNYAIWRGVFDAMRQLRAKMYKDGRRTIYIFPEAKWLEVLNILSKHMAGQIGVLPSGELFIVPSEPLPLPAPPGPAASSPQFETGEKPEPIEFKKGMHIELNDGTEVVIGWVKPGGGSIGVMPLADAQRALKKFGRITPGRDGYTFVGTDQVRQVRATQVTIEEVEKVTEQPIERAPREMPEGLLPHQPECIVWCDTVKRGIVALEQGLGKTVVAATVIDKPAVVVCPASLRINWVREINKWRPDLTVSSVGVELDERGRVRGTSSDISDEALKADVVVVSYEMIIERTPVNYELVRLASNIIERANELIAQQERADRRERIWPLARDASAHQVIKFVLPEREYKALPSKSMETVVRSVAKRMKLVKYQDTEAKPAKETKGPPKISENLQKLLNRGLDTLVVDEAQYVKELDLKYDRKKHEYEPSAKCSARAAAVWHLSKKASRRFLLTGTPIKNYTYELWALLVLVDPERWRSFHDFAVQYCGAYQGKFGWVYTGKSNSEELNQIINGKYLLRKTKDELDLPEKSRQSIEISMDEESAAEYRRAAADFIAWVEENGGPAAVQRASKSKALVKLTSLRRLAAIGKAEAVAQQADEFLSSTKRPLIVMGWHKEALEIVTKELRAAGWRVGTITGDDNAASRQAAVDEFQTGIPASAPPEERQYLDVLVCSILAAGVGLTLTRSSDMFFLERAWTPSDLVQAEDREHRIGQRNKCTVTYYDAVGTIDMYIAKMLMNKVSTAAAVIDGEDLNQDQAVDRVLGDLFGNFAEIALAKNPSDLDDAVDSGEFDWAIGAA